MTFKKGDFIEINFTGRIKGGEIFDSNIKEDLDKANFKGNPENFVFPIGEGMFIKGVDEFLIGKDLGEYNISLLPENAFGKRDSKLIQMMPISLFIQHKINPIPGAMLHFDGRLAKVMTVSGGRVMVDFNNPLAGKEVEYRIIVKKIITNQKEKIDSLNNFFFRKKFEFEIKDKKLVLKTPKGLKQLILMFKEKYKEILGLELDVEEVEKKE